MWSGSERSAFNYYRESNKAAVAVGCAWNIRKQLRPVGTELGLKGQKAVVYALGRLRRRDSITFFVVGSVG